jgi:hypothetical protein
VSLDALTPSRFFSFSTLWNSILIPFPTTGVSLQRKMQFKDALVTIVFPVANKRPYRQDYLIVKMSPFVKLSLVFLVFAATIQFFVGTPKLMGYYQYLVKEKTTKTQSCVTSSCLKPTLSCLANFSCLKTLGKFISWTHTSCQL